MSKRWWRPARLVFLTVHEVADFRAALPAITGNQAGSLLSSYLPTFWVEHALRLKETFLIR